MITKVSVAIEREFRHCDAFYISVAFITEGGLVPLLTTSYLTFTEPPDVTLIDKVRNQMQKNI